MNRVSLGRNLIVVTAVSTIVVPIGVNVLLAKDHAGNPLWLPHAKLHCAMSFFAAISLGMSALAVLWTRPETDRASAVIAPSIANNFFMISS